MAKCQICSMICTDAAAVGDHKRVSFLCPHEGYNFAQQVALILFVTSDSRSRLPPVTVETFAVDAVDTIELKQTGIDRVGKGIDHAPILVVEKAAFAGGEDQDFRPGMTENEQFHFTAQAGTEPAMILSIHSSDELTVASLSGGECGVNIRFRNGNRSLAQSW